MPVGYLPWNFACRMNVIFTRQRLKVMPKEMQENDLFVLYYLTLIHSYVITVYIYDLTCQVGLVVGTKTVIFLRLEDFFLACQASSTTIRPLVLLTTLHLRLVHSTLFQYIVSALTRRNTRTRSTRWMVYPSCTAEVSSYLFSPLCLNTHNDHGVAYIVHRGGTSVVLLATSESLHFPT